MKRDYPLHYDWATGLYAKLTNQPYWISSIRELISFTGQSTGNEILDVGCGHGISTALIAESNPGAAVTGIDISRNMIRRARSGQKSGSRVQFIQADASRLPFPDNSFECITGHGFLYMVRSKSDVMHELFRVLKPGGTIAFMEPGTSIDAIGRSAVIKDNFRNPKPKTRIKTKVLLLRLYSTRKGQITPREMENTMAKAGFREFVWKETSNSRGLLFKATKP